VELTGGALACAHASCAFFLKLSKIFFANRNSVDQM
jgi:hypothetical protein